jgi:hypothetical protein
MLLFGGHLYFDGIYVTPLRKGMAELIGDRFWSGNPDDIKDLYRDIIAVPIRDRRNPTKRIEEVALKG